MHRDELCSVLERRLQDSRNETVQSQASCQDLQSQLNSAQERTSKLTLEKERLRDEVSHLQTWKDEVVTCLRIGQSNNDNLQRLVRQMDPRAAARYEDRLSESFSYSTTPITQSISYSSQVQPHTLSSSDLQHCKRPLGAPPPPSQEPYHKQIRLGVHSSGLQNDDEPFPGSYLKQPRSPEGPLSSGPAPSIEDPTKPVKQTWATTAVLKPPPEKEEISFNEEFGNKQEGPFEIPPEIAARLADLTGKGQQKTDAAPPSSNPKAPSSSVSRPDVRHENH